MKRIDLMSLPMAHKMEPIFKLNWLPANLPTLVGIAIILTTAIVAIQKYEEFKAPEIKTLAWFMANPKEALATNKVCYDNPRLNATDNCVYSLQALEIIHKGPNS